MCGRFTLRTLPQSYAEFMAGLKFPTIEPRFNIAPTQLIWCVLSHATQPVCQEISWGLIPSWEKAPNKARRHFNARSETAAEKPSFRSAFKKRRCIVLADGFYEWASSGKSKLPFHITPGDGQLLWMAGLWEPGDDAAGPGNTCTILTTSANDFMSPLHHRMPAILNTDDVPMWIDEDFDDTQQLQALLKPADEDLLNMRQVSQYVNKASHQGPACLDGPPAQQQSLF